MNSKTLQPVAEIILKENLHKFDSEVKISATCREDFFTSISIINQKDKICHTEVYITNDYVNVNVEAIIGIINNSLDKLNTDILKKLDKLGL